MPVPPPSPSVLPLRYGVNPHQAPASVRSADGRPLPFRVLNGAPGYINLLDALNSWQLVRELRGALGLPAAASFKHVSPAGAAVAVPLPEPLRRAYFVGSLELSPLATAYARARGADRLSSFGDWIALSDPLDASTARLIQREVSDGVVAPGYAPEALDLLRQKKSSFVVLEMDPAYEPEPLEARQVFGVTLEQPRNTAAIGPGLLERVVTRATDLPPGAQRDLLVGLIALKYTQSNSVCFSRDGQVIGMGAGQQSRIHCTQLAAAKAELWHLRQHPRVQALPFREGLKRVERDNAIDGYLRGDLSPAEERLWAEAFTSVPERLAPGERAAYLAEAARDVCLTSDAFFPFRDNVDRAQRAGVRYVAQPGGSVRDADVIAACDEYGIAMAFTGVRLFHH